MTARSNRKTPTKPATTAEKNRASANTTKPPTKRARLIGMLKTGGGADVATLSDALGWQRHSFLANAGIAAELGCSREAS
jgi:hypothetical protein